jgi:hypothetical protein
MLHCLYENLWKKDDELKNNDCISLLLDQLYSQSPTKLVFGPLGERPLHLCSLSASKFEDPRVKKGILKGMKKFIREKRERGWNEVLVTYGKDYCAMIGWLMWGTDEKKFEFTKVPFSKVLSCWKCLYEKYADPNHNTEKTRKDNEILVTHGLYEGENLLFPLIASGELETVQWLLNFEKKLKQNDKISSDERSAVLAFLFPIQILKAVYRLVNQEAIGLFFRPRMRRWLASSSYKDGWTMYWQMTEDHDNVHASAPRSYFGLEILPFSVRYINQR